MIDCRCGHTWHEHAQSRLDMIECDFCGCEDYVPADELEFAR